jgi:hypothetical protein
VGGGGGVGGNGARGVGEATPSRGRDSQSERDWRR